MKTMHRLSIFILAIASPTTAFAYLDPGTGSIILQGLIAGLAAIAVSGKIYWARIKGFFSKDSSLDDQSNDSSRDSLPDDK